MLSCDFSCNLLISYDFLWLFMSGASWSPLGSVLEASWRRRGGVVEASWSVLETPKGAKRTPRRAKRGPRRAKMTQQVPPEASGRAVKNLVEEKMHNRVQEKCTTLNNYKTSLNLTEMRYVPFRFLLISCDFLRFHVPSPDF